MKKKKEKDWSNKMQNGKDGGQNLPSPNKEQRGRSMIEMLGVLAIIGVLSVGGLAGYNMAMQKIRINNLVSEFSLFVSDMSAMYAYMKYERKEGSSVQGTDISNLRKATEALGASVSGPKFGSGDYDYALGFTNLSAEACAALASNQIGEGAVVGDGHEPWYALGTQSAVRFCLERPVEAETGFLFGYRGNITP